MAGPTGPRVRKGLLVGRAGWRGRTMLRPLAVALLIVLSAQSESAAALMDVMPFAGTGTAGYSGDGGAAVLAQLRSPIGVAARPSGQVLIADSGNHRVRAVHDDVISTVAGSGVAGYAGDGGPASAALLDEPVAVAVRPSGSVLIADAGNHTIRKVEKGVISTIAGRGVRGYAGDGGPAASALLDEPRGVAVTPSGEVYVADAGNHVIRKIDRVGTMSTVAGSSIPGYSGDGGEATGARLRSPVGVAVTPSGEVYIADAGNHVLRVVDASGVITTVAGTSVGADGDDRGAAETTPLKDPTGVALSGIGILVAENGNHRLRLLVDATPPAAPVLSGTVPSQLANNNNAPRIVGHAPAGSTVSLHRDAECSSPAVVSGPAEAFSSPGLPVDVPDDTVTSYYGMTSDTFGRRSTCSGPLDYVEDSTPPAAPRIVLADVDPDEQAPAWTFAGEVGTATMCQLSRGDTVLWGYTNCPSGETYDLAGQSAGRYTFSVRATDSAGNTGPAATFTHTIVGPSPKTEGRPTPTPTADEPASPDSPATAIDLAPAPPKVGAQPTPPPETGPARAATSGPAQAAKLAPTHAEIAVPAVQRDPDSQSGAGTQVAPPPAVRSARPSALRPTAADGLARLLPESIRRVVSDALTVSAAVVRNPGVPVVLLVVVGLFLAVQHRIDRSDPKLALAPVRAAELGFSPLLPVRRHPYPPVPGASR